MSNVSVDCRERSCKQQFQTLPSGAILPDILDDFGNHLISEGRSDKTARNLVLCLSQIHNPNDIFSVKKRLADLILQGKYWHAHKTVNAVRVWGEYKKIEALTAIKYPVGMPESERDILTSGELKSLMECDPLYGPAHKHLQSNWNKFSVFFATVAGTGGRLGEVAGLTKDNIHWGTGFLYLYDGKKKKYRKIPIPNYLEEFLHPYCEELEGNELFPSISEYSWGPNFRKRMKLCGIEKRAGLTAYSLRAGYITDLLRNGALLLDVQKIAGHNNPKTTAIYYRPSDERMLETVKLLSLERENMSVGDLFTEVSRKVSSILDRLKPVKSDVVNEIVDTPEGKFHHFKYETWVKIEEEKRKEH